MTQYQITFVGAAGTLPKKFLWQSSQGAVMCLAEFLQMHEEGEQILEIDWISVVVVPVTSALNPQQRLLS